MAGRRSALGVAATATPLAVQGGSPEAVPRKRRYSNLNRQLEPAAVQAAKSPQPKLSRQPASANAWMSGVITSMNSKKQAASSLTKHVAADGARYAAPSALGQAKGCPAVPTGEASEATSLRVAAADGRGYGELDRRQSSKLARSVTAGVMGSRKLRSASAASGSSRGRGEGGGKSNGESKAALARRSSDTGPELCAPVKDTRQLTEARASFTAKLALQTELDRELAASCAHFASLRAQYTAYGEESAPERANADAGEPTGGTDTGAQIRSAVTVGGSVGGGRGAAADHKGGQNKKAVLEKRMLGYYRHNRPTLEKSLLMYETVRKELLSIKEAIAAYKRPQ